MLGEELEIAVLNASGGEKLASNISRLISNVGGDVTLISNLDFVENSKIQVKKKDYLKSYTVKLLAYILNIKEIELIQNSQFRADIMVVIGKDYLLLK